MRRPREALGELRRTHPARARTYLDPIDYERA